MSIVKNYAFWGIDTFIPYTSANDTREAVALADRHIDTTWVRKEETMLTKRPSVASLEDYGFQDRWYQLGHYDVNYVTTMDYAVYVDAIGFDKWAKMETLSPLNKRWLSKCVATNKWTKRPYDETVKIWKEY